MSAGAVSRALPAHLPAAMSVNQGRLVKLTADSGHYWPQPIHFRWLYSHLEAQGADLSSLEGIQFRTKH